MNKKSFVSWIPWVISLAVLIFVVPRLSEYGQIAEALRRSRWWWVILAFLFQGVFFASLVKVYQISYRLVGIERSFLRTFPMVFSSIFANSITPTLGLAGMAVYVKKAKEDNYTTVRAVAGFVVETVFQQGAFFIILIVNLTLLVLHNGSAGRTEILVAIMIGFALLAQVAVLAVGFLLPGTFARFLSVVSGIGNWISARLRKKIMVTNEWSHISATEMKEVVGSMLKNKPTIVKGFLVGMVMEFSLLAVFQALFYAFGENWNFPAAVAGYVSGNVAGSILVGPYGVGFVEAGLTIILQHYDIAKGAATLVAVVFRGMNFWLPFTVGFLALRRMKFFNGRV